VSRSSRLLALLALLAVTLAACDRQPAPEPEMDAALIAAAAEGNTSRIAALVLKGVNLNAQDGEGRTPLMAATYARQTAALETLLKAGADVNIRDRMLNNPFLYAGAEGLLEILKLTHAAGADPTLTNRFGGTALIPACERGHVETVRYLLEETRVNVNHVNNLGWTGLLEAILLSDGGPRHQEIVRLLIEHGADVTITDRNGVTPLRHARQRGQREIAAILEAAGARETRSGTMRRDDQGAAPL
jgi:uncharacterized protein